VRPHHLDNLSVGDLLSWNGSILPVAEGEDLVHHEALARGVEAGAQRIHAVQRRNHPPVGKFLYGFDLILGMLMPCQRLLPRKSVPVRQVRPCRRRIRTECLLPKRTATIWAGEHRIAPQIPPS
jgi:hypothetical protein